MVSFDKAVESTKTAACDPPDDETSEERAATYELRVQDALDIIAEKYYDAWRKLAE